MKCFFTVVGIICLFQSPSASSCESALQVWSCVGLFWAAVNRLGLTVLTRPPTWALWCSVPDFNWFSWPGYRFAFFTLSWLVFALKDLHHLSAHQTIARQHVAVNLSWGRDSDQQETRRNLWDGELQVPWGDQSDAAAAPACHSVWSSSTLGLGFISHCFYSPLSYLSESPKIALKPGLDQCRPTDCGRSVW